MQKYRSLLPIFFLLLSLFIWSCGSESQNQTDADESAEMDESGDAAGEEEGFFERWVTDESGLDALGIQYETTEMPAYKLTEDWKETYYEPATAPDVFSTDISLDSYNLAQLRFLYNYYPAVRGHMFMDASERADFEGYKWYQPVFWEEDFEPALTNAESEFMDRVRQKMDEMQANNVPDQGGKLISTGNIVNTNMFAKETLKKSQRLLKKNAFAIVPARHEQFFHVYDGNSYQGTPNFITTDMYLQLVHIFFSHLLRDIEEKKFIPNLSALLKGLFEANQSAASKNAGNPEMLKAAEFNQFFFGLGYELLTGKSVGTIPSSYASEYKETKEKVMGASGQGSKLLQQPFFQYGLFKPRGHYSYSEDLKRYFRAMIWLQTAPLNYENKPAFDAGILAAGQLRQSEELMGLYRSLYEPILYLVGEPNRLSVMNVYEIMESSGYSPGRLINEEDDARRTLKQQLIDMDPAGFKVVAATQQDDELANPLAIHFIPQRYTFDAEILSRLVMNKREDVTTEEPLRPVPKGLDVFAGMGNPTAEKLLLDYYKEGRNWPAYPDSLKKVQEKFSNYDKFDLNVYNKWMKSLKLLDRRKEDNPFFMDTEAWAMKSLNTGLASWTELKHDVILYAEQPIAAEMGGPGELWPEPTTLGYVEPNVEFWEASLSMLRKTKSILGQFDLNVQSVTERADAVIELGEFFRDCSKKELAGKSLSEEEYERIRYIGGEIEALTLNILDNGANTWYEVTGPDKFVAVVADVYTYAGYDKKVALEEGVGYVNDIYVAVEIDGNLVLTNGAVFSYHEFERSPDQRLTDEEWQKMLMDEQAPPVPGWVQDLMVTE